MFISKRKHEPAHYMLKIDSFSFLLEAKTLKIESDVFEASGHKWRLDLYPNGNNEEDKGRYISLYAVICDTGSCSKGWEVCVDVCFFVYDHIHHNYVTFQDVNGHRTRFHEKNTTWGFDKLLSLDSFMEGENGYLFDDSSVFGAEVIAVPLFTQIDRCLLMTKPLSTMNNLSWTITRFSDVADDVLCSEVFKVGKVKWKLKMYPKGLKSGKGTHLSIFLAVHDAPSFPSGWKVYAKFKLKLKSKGTESDAEKEADGWFHNLVLDWGFSSFMLLSQLNDSENGFLLNDNLVVQVEILVMGTLKYFI